MEDYDKNLDEALQKLQKCQDEKNLDSCYNCDKLLDCSIREEYVKSVYYSMSGGDEGGFEF